MIRDELTDAAVLIADADGTRVWVPRSLITSLDMHRNGRTAELEIPEWFATKEGLV